MSGLDLLLSQSSLWYMLLVAIVAGVILGVLCDGLFILRILCRDPRARATSSPTKEDEATVSPVDPTAPLSRRARVRHGAYATLRGFCDFLSVLFATVVLMLLCYYTSDGQLRAPAIFGMSAGFVGYHKTVSRLVRRLLAWLCDQTFRCFRFLWVHTIGRLLHSLFCTIKRRLRNAVTTRRINRLTRNAARGFGISDEPPTSQLQKEREM